MIDSVMRRVDLTRARSFARRHVILMALLLNVLGSAIWDGVRLLVRDFRPDVSLAGNGTSRLLAVGAVLVAVGCHLLRTSRRANQALRALLAVLVAWFYMATPPDRAPAALPVR